MYQIVELNSVVYYSYETFAFNMKYPNRFSIIIILGAKQHPERRRLDVFKKSSPPDFLKEKFLRVLRSSVVKKQVKSWVLIIQ